MSDLTFQGMAGHLIRRLHQRAVQVFATQAKGLELDLTPVQYAALEALSARPGMDQAGLATAIAADRATIGGVIDRLVTKGFVAREVSQTDRRARVLTLTGQGAQILARFRPVVAGFQDEILSGLTPAERATFLTLAAKAAAG